MWSSISPLELASVAFAVAYLALAIRQSVLCWPAALISVALAMLLFFDSRLYMESALQIFYFGMAIYGWYEWRRGGERGTGVRIHWWSAARHAVVFAAVGLLSLGFGWLLSHTDAAFPYVDSFTTVAAIITTFMVARKVMENWLYWFVIDAVSVYIYWQRDLPLYAALFVLYLVLIVIGYRAWHRDWRATLLAADA